MLQRLVFVAVLLMPVAALAEDLPTPGAAVKLRDYSEVRRSAGDYLSQIVPDYYGGLPNAWLAPGLNCGGMESLQQEGDFYLLAFDGEQGTRWAVVAPILSRDFYLDAVRGSLGVPAETDGLDIFDTTASACQTRGDHFFVKTTDNYAVTSYDKSACLAAFKLLKANKIQPLFDEKAPEAVQVAITGQYLVNRRDRLQLTLQRLQMLFAASLESPVAYAYCTHYARSVSEFLEQVDHLKIAFSYGSRLMDVRFTVTPKADSLLARFMSRQKPMKNNLLQMIEGEPIFAAAGRFEDVALLQPAYAASVRKLYATLPTAALTDTAVEFVSERVRRFGEIFGGNLAAAMLQTPANDFKLDYRRIYRVNDAAEAVDYFAWQIEQLKKLRLSVEQKGSDPESDIKMRLYDLRQPTAMPEAEPRTVAAAAVDEHMLVASGRNAEEALGQLAAATEQKPAASVAASPLFAAATADPPAGASAMAYFSVTGFLHWAAQSGKPGSEQLLGIRPSGGIAAWLVPGKEQFYVYVRIPAQEIAEVRQTIFGDTPVLDLPMW